MLVYCMILFQLSSIHFIQVYLKGIRAVIRLPGKTNPEEYGLNLHESTTHYHIIKKKQIMNNEKRVYS